MRRILIGLFEVVILVMGFCWLGPISSAYATPIVFTATGNPSVTGFVTIDDATFNGSPSQSVPNTQITDLSLSVFGFSFSFADVVTLAPAATIINSSALEPLIVDGNGLLANNGSQQIAFRPSFGADGDADLLLSAGSGNFLFGVAWVAQVPEPSTLSLIGLGLLGVGAMARRRQKQQQNAV